LILKNINESKLNIENIEYSIYELEPISSLNSESKEMLRRNGCLFRIHFKDFGIGYSDCFSWPELGDTSLTEKVKMIQVGKMDFHIEKSFSIAKTDAFYRFNRENAFKKLCLINNHFTCVNFNLLTTNFIENLKKEGFKYIKLKCGFDLEKEASFLKKISPILKSCNIKVRLDFNGSSLFDEMHQFLTSLDKYLSVISFLEDPFKNINNEWLQIKLLFPELKIALDRTNNSSDYFNIKEAYDYLILKPAIQNYDEILNFKNYNISRKKILFTSYMDHPLGQLSALYEASEYYNRNKDKQQICGFLTHNLYKINSYSERIKVNLSQIIPPYEGFGFGFDDLLENENWRKIW
jgi:O-succinylbenzoate synthase